MDPGVRRRVALKAAEATKGLRGWLHPLPAEAYPRPGMFAAAAAVVVALALLPITLRHQGGPGDQGVTKIEVVASQGVVRLAWSDGNKTTYTVYKSQDPRSFARGEAHRVQGNVWTDSDPASSQVIFYRIE